MHSLPTISKLTTRQRQDTIYTVLHLTKMEQRGERGTEGRLSIILSPLADVLLIDTGKLEFISGFVVFT